eukprot:11188120-Lingulodinium_polyedra.AAC.1
MSHGRTHGARDLRDIGQEWVWHWRIVRGQQDALAGGVVVGLLVAHADSCCNAQDLAHNRCLRH